VAASLALLAASAPGGALLVDLAGDVPAVLGLPEPRGPGVRDWLAADAGVEADAIEHLAEPVTPGVRVLPAGTGPVDGRAAVSRVELLARTLAAHSSQTVVDVGVAAPAWQPLLTRSDYSLLVIRPCYLALRRAARLGTRPTGVVLICEPARALGRREVEDVTGAKVVAEIHVEPSIARAVDAGLLASRLPRGLARPLRAAA
jgi:hypothetical protein